MHRHQSASRKKLVAISRKILFSIFGAITGIPLIALLQHFEESFKGAVQALQAITDDKLEDKFILQNNGQQLMSTSKRESIGSTINHWVHHREQLTVYMRLNDIPVPSIYGPSADEKVF